MDIKEGRIEEQLQNQIRVFSFDNSDQKLATAAVGTATALAPVAVLAQNSTTVDVSAVTNMITALSGIAAAVTTVVVGAMAIRMAIKLVNRVAVKG